MVVLAGAMLETTGTGAAGGLATPLRAAASRVASAEALVAVGAFAVFCLAVLTRSTSLLEPDDFAYRASIVALTHGHITLTSDQYAALTAEIGRVAQWVQLPSGAWISEKNPGYPFFAVPFQLLGALRLAPLFYGALGCVGLYFGGRRWLGRWGGTVTVVLYLASGAALVFAWRATMPTFTDASLVAAGTGALLWAMLAIDATPARRTLAGTAAFLALEAATFVRYTDGVVLAVAVAAVLLARRRAGLPPRALAWWLGTVAAFGGLVAAFDAHYYGGVTKTGYSSGEITFGLSAVLPNLEHMPSHLVRSMPLLVPALVAVGWIGVRAVRGGPVDTPARRRDAAVGAALAASWLGIFALYSAYTWTVGQSAHGNSTLHVVRFYVPALAAAALLAAWLLVHLPRWVTVAGLAALVCAAAIVYPGLAGNSFGGPGGPGGPGRPGGRLGPPPGGVFPGGGPPPAGVAPNGAFPGGGPPGSATP
jgi:hypothetical protein